MPLGATSLLAPVPTKKMGFTIESLVGGETTPPKSDSGSPPLRHHALSNSRMFASELGPDIARDRYFHSENNFSARELQSGLLFHRDIMALQRQQQEQQQREHIASEVLLREQLFMRHRAQIQEHLNQQEQMKRNSLNRELIHQEISRELLNSRIHSDFDQQRRSPNCESAASTKRVKSSPRTTPRGSPSSSPCLPQTTSSPQSYTEEDRRSSASPLSNNNNNNNINRSTSPLSSLKKHQSSSPNLISPSGLPPHSAGSFLSPLQHSSMLPNLHPQFLGGGPSPIHIPTPMVQHHLLGGGLPQGLGGNLGGGGLVGGMGGGLGTPLPAVARDFPLYPWLISARHGRVFPPGFPGQDGYPGFLLPFRKPKRIRTAFSPSQLLKLEQAFEKNQYVVGQERKQLAQTLNLSETQVKVWFQNRRTKHKRQQQEDEEGGGGKAGSEGDKSAEEGLIIEHEEEDEDLDVLEETGEV